MSSRKWAIFMVGGPALLIAGVVAVAIADNALYSPRKFDAEQWRAGDPRQRMRMASDLHRVIVGKTRDETLELLGPADWENPGLLLEYKVVHGDVMGLFEWGERLQVPFDRETGRVTGITFFD